MPQTDIKNDPQLFRHSEEIRDIITTVPSIVLRWGIMLFVGVFVMIVGLAATIHYPDIVTTTLKINTRNEKFFAEIVIPQNSIRKVAAGQRVIIKLNSYPYEQYGSLEGVIKSKSASVDNNGDYLAEVEINTSAPTMNNAIQLSPGMRGEAEIVTQDATILQRISRNIFFKVINNK
jgi:multidrug efflux pump subunit AcrA (membrane-fusion protein)